ncbi:MAG: histidine kinase dimerization/phospho-acceptor domain-containing protein [Geminicoccaceae bacterium]
MASLIPRSPSGTAPLGTYETAEHELRTPLASIRSIAEILRDYPDLSEAQRRHFVDAIIADAHRLGGTIDRVLAHLDDAPTAP